MSNPQIYKKNPQLPWQTIHGETIIIDPKTQNSFELNELGSFIWQLIDGKNTTLEIQNGICEHYDAPPEVVTKDLSDLFNLMIENQLVVSGEL